MAPSFDFNLFTDTSPKVRTFTRISTSTSKHRTFEPLLRRVYFRTSQRDFSASSGLVSRFRIVWKSGIVASIDLICSMSVKTGHLSEVMVEEVNLRSCAWWESKTFIRSQDYLKSVSELF